MMGNQTDVIPSQNMFPGIRKEKVGTKSSSKTHNDVTFKSKIRD